MSDNKNPAPYSCATSGCLHDILATRLAAAGAERDAAVAAMLLAGKQMVEFGERSHSDGERRATAAIVAWLRDDAADGKTQFQLARAIRRGDHLKGTSNE